MISGKLLEYRTLEQMFQVVGDKNHPLNIDSPQLLATADRLWVDRKENVGALEGEGWMIARDETTSSIETQLPPRDNAKGIRVDWRDKVKLTFAEATANADSSGQSSGLKIRHATFVDDVRVSSPDLTMRADTMDVAMPSPTPDAKTKETRASLESIIASGNVHAQSVSDGGSIDCGTLHISFVRNLAERTVPQTMTATQSVAALDADQQWVWCEKLHVQFETEVAVGQTASSPAVNVRLLTATDQVQALLANGARAFADTLEADPIAETIALSGEDVIVVTGSSIIHRGKRLEFHQKSNVATWPGPGEFVQFKQPIAESRAQPMARPVIAQIDAASNPRELVARWSDSMTYDAAFDDGAGQITLAGNVIAESDPTALQHNTLDAEELTLQFSRGAASTSPDQAASIADHSKRALKLMIAKGANGEFAKVESVTWEHVDHHDEPRIFYIAGSHIEYDDQQFEAFVRGAGEMLVRDPRQPDEATPAGTQPAFSAKGTTSFRWTEQLVMKRADGNEFNVQMDGGIHVVHSAIDDSLTKISCRQLAAVIERTNEAAAQKSETMDFGGAMEVKSLRGSGAVFIVSPTRDIDCAEFDYVNATGIANLIGPPDGSVAVISKGVATPLRARRVIWNMKTNTVTATDISGAVGR
jgi:hypothetical protein